MINIYNYKDNEKLLIDFFQNNFVYSVKGDGTIYNVKGNLTIGNLTESSIEIYILNSSTNVRNKFNVTFQRIHIDKFNNFIKNRRDNIINELTNKMRIDQKKYLKLLANYCAAGELDNLKSLLDNNLEYLKLVSLNNSLRYSLYKARVDVSNYLIDRFKFKIPLFYIKNSVNANSDYDSMFKIITIGKMENYNYPCLLNEYISELYIHKFLNNYNYKDKLLSFSKSNYVDNPVDMILNIIFKNEKNNYRNEIYTFLNRNNLLEKILE